MTFMDMQSVGSFSVPEDDAEMIAQMRQAAHVSTDPVFAARLLADADVLEERLKSLVRDLHPLAEKP